MSLELILVNTTYNDLEEIREELALKAYKDYEVVYMVDSGVAYKEDVTFGSTALIPETFTPTKSGYEFIGWRLDNSASSDILTEAYVGVDPLTLFAVFRKIVTLSYSGNGATSGSTSSQSGYVYYNNGNQTSVSFNLASNGFTKTNWRFSKWNLGTVGTTINISSDTTATAVWVGPLQQSGTYSKNHQNTWSYTQYITFPTAFTSTPTVTLSKSMTDTSTGWDVTGIMSCSATNISTTGFTLNVSIVQGNTNPYKSTTNWVAKLP